MEFTYPIQLYTAPYDTHKTLYAYKCSECGKVIRGYAHKRVKGNVTCYTCKSNKRKEKYRTDNISVVTVNSNCEYWNTSTTVDKLIESWMKDIDIPANDDKVVSCVLGNTPISISTFGDLMELLTVVKTNIEK